MVSEGPSEAVKGGAHIIALCVCSVLFAHNMAAWLTRPNTENGINSVVYGTGIAFEWSRAMRHLRGGVQ
jgi:hypothetical protein